MEIFNETLNRLKLLSQKQFENNKIIKIAIHRNHSFEMIATVLNSFLNFSKLKAEFLYSDYDDSLNFTEIAKNADLNIIWLDLERYKNINIKEWLKERILTLKTVSNGKIIVYTTGEIDLSDINISDVIIADSNNVKEHLQDSFLDLAKQEYSGTRYSNKTCLYIARELGLIYIPAFFIPNIKAIVLDLDNTLYEGVLGEDGINGIKPFYELQKHLKKLKEQGLFLAIVSKNEYIDVENMLKTKKDLPLKFADFSDIQANWNSKSENIAKIAKNLNIGIDSMLYIDDNIGELESVKLNYPLIKTIEAGSEPHTLNTLKYYPGLYKSTATNEDKIRTKDVQANRERENLINTLTQDEYFKRLEISLTYNLNPENELKRVTELINKTNQFIFNYARYSATEIEKIYNDKNSCIITAAMKDKLSDSGIIGILIAHKQGNTAIIDELTVSCRALGRNIENILIENLFNFANKQLATDNTCLQYKKGERNAPALSWLTNYSGQQLEDNGKILIQKNKPQENKFIKLIIKNEIIKINH